MTIKNVRDFIYQLTGNYYSEDRLFSLKQKVFHMLKDKGIVSNINKIDGKIEILLKDENLIDELINYITINETSFFRHIEQLNTFKKNFLKDILRNPSSKILSAGCSTGEEPYTLAMLSLSIHPTLNTKKIVGIDINKKALEIAKKGEYPARYEKNIPKEYKKYIEVSEKILKMKNEVKKLIEFRKGNLVAKQFSFPNYFSAVFFRNVMIYFTKDKKRKALENLHNSMQKRGILVLAPTETIGYENMDLFEPFKVNRFVFFRKK